MSMGKEGVIVLFDQEEKEKEEVREQCGGDGDDDDDDHGDDDRTLVTMLGGPEPIEACHGRRVAPTPTNRGSLME